MLIYLDGRGLFIQPKNEQKCSGPFGLVGMCQKGTDNEDIALQEMNFISWKYDRQRKFRKAISSLSVPF
jgi:hypothetical protein